MITVSIESAVITRSNQVIIVIVVSYVTESAVSLTVDHVLDFILSLDLRLTVEDNSSLSVTLHSREKKQTWTIHYTCSNHTFTAQVLYC